MRVSNSFLLVVLIGLVVGGPLSAQPAGVLYGSEVSLDDLGIIDRLAAGWTMIGSQGISGSITGLAHDPGADVLSGCSPSNDSLYTLNQSTGLATLVGPTGFSNINGLAYDSNNDILYCTDLNGNAFFTIDVTTGAGTLVGTITGASNVEGLAYDPASDTLYGLDDNLDTIVVINAATGAATPLTNGLASSGLWRGLTFDSELGVIWATKVNPGEVHSVDPLTGTSTLLGSTLTFVQGLAFEPAPQYQVNQPGASLDIDGIQGTIITLAVANLGQGQTAMMNFASTNTGQPWDLVFGLAPPLTVSQGAPITVDNQIINIDLSDPTLSTIWSFFQSPGFQNFQLPLSFTNPFSASAQLAVLEPAAPSGLSLSQPVRLVVP